MPILRSAISSTIAAWNVRFITFLKVLVLSGIETALFRIWTKVAVFIFIKNKYYTSATSKNAYSLTIMKINT